MFQHRSGAPILVGGVKPALGHSEGASGLSSIIKVVLALENSVIPATIGVNNVNPSIKLDEWNVQIVRKNRAWPNSAAHRAGVNSFGFGGANGHAIIEAAPDHSGHRVLHQNGDVNGGHHNGYLNGAHQNGHANGVHQNGDTNGVHLNGHTNGIYVNGHTNGIYQNGHANGVHQNGDMNGLHQNGDTVRGADELDTPTIFLFSAATQDSLLKQFGGIGSYASYKKDLNNMKDLAFTLNCHRSRLAVRGFLVAPSISFQNDPESLSPTTSGDGFSAKLDMTFVYTGQGAQWPGLGSQLIYQFPSFRRSIRYYDQCLQALDQCLRPSWTIEATILDKDANDIHLADRSQPICTAVQLALTDLLQDWNIKPQTVVGHSSGEIAAAYAAGYIDSRQAILSSYLRGLSVSLSQEKGGMLAVGLSRDQSQQVVEELDLCGAVCVACVNSPGSSTLSGDSEAVDKLQSVLQARGIFARRLKTNNKAYHSHHMRAVGPIYETLLQRVWYGNKTKGKQLQNGVVNGHSAPTTRMISSVTQTCTIASDVATPSYWRANLESAVEFKGAISFALRDGPTHFVEIGPHSALELPIKEIANQLNGSQENYLYHSALSRGKDASVSVLNLVGSLFLHSHDEISFKTILESGNEVAREPAKILVDLPAYPWDYSSQCPWIEPRNVTEFRNRKYPRHDLLGSQLPGGSKANTTWRNILDIDEISWLKDHKLGPSIVFPAAAYIAMATEAVCQVHDIQLYECPGVTLNHVNFLKAMDFHPEQRPRIEIFTEMERLRISNTTSSNKWWRFSVSSISRDQTQSITHAVCLVGLSGDIKASTPRQINLDRSLMEQQATHVWYEKFTQEGLNWGPQFAVMEDIFCDSARKSCVATATTHLIRDDDNYPRAHPKYIVHPISIDALLQTAFVATTHGWTRDLRATVPVSIESIQVSSPAALNMDVTRPWFIDSRSEPVGFGTVNIEAELVNESEDVVLRMQNVRAIRFQGNARTESPKANTSLVRVAWRPDVTALASGPNDGFSRYLDWFEKTYSQGEVDAERSGIRFAGALDLIAFKWPNLRILAVDCGSETVQLFMSILRAENDPRRFNTFTQARIAENGELRVLNEVVNSTESVNQNGTSKVLPLESKFDVIITAIVSIARSIPPV